MELDNRSNILECALRLFAAYGYEGVGIQRIVEAAQITKPTLYHYFGSKHGLLAALLDAYYDQLHQSLTTAAAYNGDLPVTLNTITSAYFRFANKHPVFYRMQLAMWFAPIDSEPYKLTVPFRQRQGDLIKNVFLQAACRFDDMRERDRIYSATFLGMIHTYISMSLNGHVVLDEVVANRAVCQFMHGIFA
jgi:TetR/AcrR family transcriptional regulator